MKKDEMIFKFKEICSARLKANEKKYLDEDGNNKALTERDNLEDVMEEFSDIYNIYNLYIQRCLREGNLARESGKIMEADIIVDGIRLARSQQEKIEKLVCEIMELLYDPCYPPEFRHENITRVGFDNNGELFDEIDKENIEKSVKKFKKVVKNIEDNGGKVTFHPPKDVSNKEVGDD